MASVSALLTTVRIHIFWREHFPQTWRAHAELAVVLRMMQHVLLELSCGQLLLTCAASEAFRFVRALGAPLRVLDKGSRMLFLSAHSARVASDAAQEKVSRCPA